MAADRDVLREESKEGASARRSFGGSEGWPLVRSEIVEAREAVDAMLAESLHLQADAFAEQADRLVADHLARPPTRLRRACGRRGRGRHRRRDRRGGSAAEPERARQRQNPHDVRIAGKALRYTLEMAEVEGTRPGRP